MKIENSGLKLVKRDRRDFSYEKNFGAPPLHSEDLFLAPFSGPKNQLNTSLCTAFAVTKLREDTERVVLSPEFQFMLSKKIEGNWTTFGANQYDATYAAADSPVTVSALSASEKIYGGGYKTTTTALSNAGLYQDISTTGGADYVVRAVAHSDGVCSPRAILYDQTGGAEIGHLDGTTAST